MPHDANGQLLRVGDVVSIPGVITHIAEGEFCTTTVETEYIMPGNGQKSSICAINAAQVVKRVGGRIYPCGCRASGSDDLPDYCPEHHGLSDDQVNVPVATQA